MLLEITEREAYLVNQFRNAGVQHKAIISTSLHIPLTEQETREAVEFCLESREGPTSAIDREMFETAFSQSNQEYTEGMEFYLQGLKGGTQPPLSEE